MSWNNFPPTTTTQRRILLAIYTNKRRQELIIEEIDIDKATVNEVEASLVDLKKKGFIVNLDNGEYQLTQLGKEVCDIRAQAIKKLLFDC